MKTILEAMDGQDFRANRKKALLLSALGKEEQHVFKCLSVALDQDGQKFPDAYKKQRKDLKTDLLRRLTF